MIKGHPKIVVDDVRFPNEEASIAKLGGVLVHIDRPGVLPIADHISEAYSDTLLADYEIHNCGALEGLLGAVDNIAGDVATMVANRKDRSRQVAA